MLIRGLLLREPITFGLIGKDSVASTGQICFGLITQGAICLCIARPYFLSAILAFGLCHSCTNSF